MTDWHGMKGMWVDRMLDRCCDFQHSPHSWPWPWIFKVKFWNILKLLYLRNGIADLHRTKGMWVDRMLDPCCDFQHHLNHDLDLGFSRSNFWKVIYRNVTLIGSDELIWCCTYYVAFSYDQSPWPWIFKVKFCKCFISGKGGPIEMEWKGCESIGC